MMKLLIISITQHMPQNRINDTIIMHMTLNSISSAVNTSGRTLCFQLGNQQTCTSNNHNSIKEGLIFNLIFADSHHGFANAPQLSLQKSYRQKLENLKNEPNNTHILPYLFHGVDSSNHLLNLGTIAHEQLWTMLELLHTTTTISTQGHTL